MRPKYIRLAESIKKELPQRREKGLAKLPSEAALMERHGVSRDTVRRALALLAAEGLIQSRRGSGYYVRRAPGSDLYRIDIIITHASEYIFPALLEELRTILAGEGYDVAVHATQNSLKAEREILLALLAEPGAGILAEGSRTALPNPNVDLYEQLRAGGVPLVFLHGAHRGLSGAVCVGDDNFGGGYRLAKYLADRGHERIAGIFKIDDVQGIERYHGYMSALRDAQLLPDDRHILWFTTEEREALLENGSAGLMEPFLSGRLADCTAAVCYNDEIAYRFIKALLAVGKRVPEDMAVVSFDNSYYCELGRVGITSLAHEPMAMSRRACECLLAMIGGRPCASAALPWRLVERKSSLYEGAVR